MHIFTIEIKGQSLTWAHKVYEMVISSCQPVFYKITDGRWTILSWGKVQDITVAESGIYM